VRALPLRRWSAQAWQRNPGSQSPVARRSGRVPAQATQQAVSCRSHRASGCRYRSPECRLLWKEASPDRREDSSEQGRNRSPVGTVHESAKTCGIREAWHRTTSGGDSEAAAAFCVLDRPICFPGSSSASRAGLRPCPPIYFLTGGSRGAQLMTGRMGDAVQVPGGLGRHFRPGAMNCRSHVGRSVKKFRPHGGIVGWQ
jgi:hypothetical protein